MAQSFAIGAIVLFVLYFKLGLPWLLWLALALAAAGGLLFLAPQALAFLGPLGGFDAVGGGAQIGMGATVASDAVIEPGARVEMGADVGPRAVVRADAVVRMGASVGADAVIERGGVVSWGASVHKGAVVEAGATVGAGSDVLTGARVPAGMWLRPGSTFGARSTPQTEALRPPPPVAETDPRQARVTAVCGKLEAELRAAPERVREFLGESSVTIASLRGTCEDLARRERELRTEASAAALQRLDEERSALEKRIANERDEQIGRSLRGALAAIDEQKRQRELLKLAADRLDAEHTRLVYTLEGLASQFVRMRTSGAQAAKDPAEMERAVGQLRQELDAISDALEEVSLQTTPASPLQQLAEGPATGSDTATRPTTRTRE